MLKMVISIAISAQVFLKQKVSTGKFPKMIKEK